ncbi:hypothetical protein DFH08DRAFT_881821 [Mycena albidolilacea]|uniref:Uncharacterized protein n=1 Tax=Mycena albidolilacea TaxID=1033008 RepID=A0AAD7ELB4_9AGAR|nr:hypothetical protein DFH08DRAFT_881821 [Mycena albidolilacea]
MVFYTQLFILVGINVRQNEREMKKESDLVRSKGHECAGCGSSRPGALRLQLRITNTRSSCSPLISGAHIVHTAKLFFHHRSSYPLSPSTIHALAEGPSRASLPCIPPVLGVSSSSLPVRILHPAITRPCRAARRRSALDTQGGECLCGNTSNGSVRIVFDILQLKKSGGGALSEKGNSSIRAHQVPKLSHLRMIGRDNADGRREDGRREYGEEERGEPAASASIDHTTDPQLPSRSSKRASKASRGQKPRRARGSEYVCAPPTSR